MAGTVALTMLAQRGSYSEAAGGEPSTQQMDAQSETSERTPPTQQKGSKSKRVRTGCLTCRDRHLKCDEGTPVCMNCLKSSRNCQRGLRINWQDTPSKHVPFLLSQPNDYTVTFQDESREIASEYQGGLEQYGPQKRSRASEPPGYHNHRTHHHRPSYPDVAFLNLNGQQDLHQPSPQSSMTMQVPEPQGADYLTDQKKVLYMQVFVEEIGIWMDSMDSMKHFSRLLPFYALREPMLLNACLACGARHLALVNPRYSDEEALRYYEKATRYLLDALHDANRNTTLCATTAVILNVYEIMCERAMQRMNHIAGARALIKECRWNAQSEGIGAACFWLNVGMELLSCLHFNWQVAWDPDEWGIDMDLTQESEPGREEVWTHRIVYIVAKVCNLRSIPRDTNIRQQDPQQRYVEWLQLKALADTWNECIPRTMHPMGFLHPGQTLSGSAFPEVWLIKRTSIVARLFYHTCMCLLAQINPLVGRDDPEMQEILQEHAQMICGISAHVKDRGVASVALRSLAIAAECQTDHRAQEEVLQIIDKIRQETGWRVGFINDELKKKWGWNEPQDMSQPQQQQQPLQAPQPQPQQQAPLPMMRPGYNPLAGVGFENPQHPYQEVYVAPNVNNMMQQAHMQQHQHQQQQNNQFATNVPQQQQQQTHYSNAVQQQAQQQNQFQSDVQHHPQQAQQQQHDGYSFY